MGRKRQTEERAPLIGGGGIGVHTPFGAETTRMADERERRASAAERRRGNTPEAQEVRSESSSNRNGNSGNTSLWTARSTMEGSNRYGSCDNFGSQRSTTYGSQSSTTYGSQRSTAFGTGASTLYGSGNSGNTNYGSQNSTVFGTGVSILYGSGNSGSRFESLASTNENRTGRREDFPLPRWVRTQGERYGPEEGLMTTWGRRFANPLTESIENVARSGVNAAFAERREQERQVQERARETQQNDATLRVLRNAFNGLMQAGMRRTNKEGLVYTRNNNDKRPVPMPRTVIVNTTKVIKEECQNKHSENQEEKKEWKIAEERLERERINQE